MPPLGHENIVARTRGVLSPEQKLQLMRLRELEEAVKMQMELTAPARATSRLFRRTPDACSVKVSHDLQEDGSERLVSWLVRDYGKVSLVTQKQRRIHNDTDEERQFIASEQPQERLKLDSDRSLYFEAGTLGENVYGGTPVGVMRDKPAEYEAVLNDVVETLDRIHAAEVANSIGQAAITL